MLRDDLDGVVQIVAQLGRLVKIPQYRELLLSAFGEDIVHVEDFVSLELAKIRPDHSADKMILLAHSSEIL